MLPVLKRRIGDLLLAAFDGAAALVALSGAAVVAFFGKFLLAVVLGAVSLGFFLRFASRRETRTPGPAPLSVARRSLAGVLACIEVGVLVEAANLPVRFYQEGFEPYHWLLVVVALAVAFAVNLRLMRALRK